MFQRRYIIGKLDTKGDKVKKEDIVFYIGHINYIGGVETWIYEIAKIYSKNRNIVLLYNKSDARQLLRLEKYIKCIKYIGQDIECNKFIFCYDHSAIRTVKAKEYILTIHADYKVQNLRITIPKETTAIYAVSETAKQSFIETHKDQLDALKLDMKVLYNPISPDKPKKVLHLISATRLTKEKGGQRMTEMLKAFNRKGYSISWLVFCSNGTIEVETTGMALIKPTLNITDYIADADYLIQLSDTEGYAYSIIEALILGTPVVITELPIRDEMGVVEGVNGFVVKFDLSNLDEVVDKMWNNNLKGFKYTKKESNEEYLKILGEETKSNYKPDKSMVIIKVRSSYFDIELNRLTVFGEEILVTESRYKDLVSKVGNHIELVS